MGGNIEAVYRPRGLENMTDTAAAPIVEVQDLQKTYGTHRALAGISFQVSRGEILGFLGPNGAGKTTTMKILTGYLRPSGGRARIGGVDVTHDRLAAQKLIGYLPE